MADKNPPPYEWEMIQYDEIRTAEIEQMEHIKNTIIDLLQLELDSTNTIETVNIDFKYKNIAITMRKKPPSTTSKWILSTLQVSGLFIMHHLTSLRLLIKFL